MARSLPDRRFVPRDVDHSSEVDTDRIERGRDGSAGTGLDQHVAEGRRFDWSGGDGASGAVSGQLAQQRVL